MTRLRPLAAIALVALLPFVTGCRKSGTDGPGSNCLNGVCPFTNTQPPANGVAQFTVLPIQPAPGLSLTALGNLNPPGHVLPTDHVYFYAWDLSKPGQSTGAATRNVYMPTTGTLFQKLQPSPIDWKLMFRVTQDFYFYLDHVVPTKTINVGDVVPAGTLIGTTDIGGTLDLGAFDQSVTHDGFVNPARYPFQSRYYVSPWKYFAPSLQPALYAQIYRAPTAPDKDGRIDFGIAGKLVGDWFLQGMPIDSSSGPYGWTRSVAFVYDYYDPSKVRISIGGTIGPAGVWAIAAADPRPETVGTANGMVAYHLVNPFDGGPQNGLLLVQMVSDTQIRIELFPGSTASTGQFDTNAATFVR
ncbi:MAG: hypothetical protein HY059_05685 [Proteobacteria bacterium]|nr:hypothetical protein [Pseudomonadota bacterium]